MSAGLVSAYLSAVLSKEGGWGRGGGVVVVKRKCMLECKSCLQG